MNKRIAWKHKLLYSRNVNCFFSAAVIFVSACSGYSKTAASWDFSEGVPGTAVISAPDSVSGLVAVPAVRNAGSPKYVAGKNGGLAVDFTGINAVLEVTDDAGVMGSGFSQLDVTFDVKLSADAASTVTLLRNGHQNPNISFSIYLQAGNVIGVQMADKKTGQLASLRTLPGALSVSAGWQTVSVIWDGKNVSILVDGTAQPLTTGRKQMDISSTVSSLATSDSPMGIGGIRRADTSIGQFFNGAIGNIKISDAAPMVP